MRILVVEDDPRMAGILSRALRDTGYAVDVASDGVHAADQAAMIPYDLMVLDVLLPGIDGFAVCQRVARLEHEGFVAPVNGPQRERRVCHHRNGRKRDRDR